MLCKLACKLSLQVKDFYSVYFSEFCFDAYDVPLGEETHPAFSCSDVCLCKSQSDLAGYVKVNTDSN